MKNLCRNMDQSGRSELETSMCRKMTDKVQQLQKERTMIEELEKLLIDSDEQIKRLNQSLSKAQQREKNKSLFFETRIAQLESQNAQYRKRLHFYEGSKSKREQMLNISQKMSKSTTKNSLNVSASENSQNINTLNTIFQQCHDYKCIEEKQVLAQICTQIMTSIERIIEGLKIRSFTDFKSSDYHTWSHQIKAEIKRNKMYQGKESLTLLKRLQIKMNDLQYALEHNFYLKQSNKMLEQMNAIRNKQKTLIQIPFLERIDNQDNIKENTKLVIECRSIRDRILIRLNQRQ